MQSEEPIATTEERDPGPGIPELLDEAELCELLRISPATARRLRASKQLGYCKYGVRVKYRRKHVEDFLDAHEIPATEERRPGMLHMVKAG